MDKCIAPFIVFRVADRLSVALGDMMTVNTSHEHTLIQWIVVPFVILVLASIFIPDYEKENVIAVSQTIGIILMTAITAMFLIIWFTKTNVVSEAS